ncbi:hypothetical protein LXL04_031237 [Taraxacum kok-saghyz]
MSGLPKTGGRKKIQMKKIESGRERAVTLTKRHNGLFKKAHELATLCGVQIAVICFSLSGKPLSFGSPNVPFIINKFLNTNQVEQQPNDSITRFINSYHESELQVLNRKLDELKEELAKETKKGQILQERLRDSLGCNNYEEYIKSLGVEELKELKYKLEELKRNAECELDDISGGSTSANGDHEADLSKIGAPKDYLKM